MHEVFIKQVNNSLVCSNHVLGLFLKVSQSPNSMEGKTAWNIFTLSDLNLRIF